MEVIGFFDATAHPTAVFSADIQHASDGFDAVGMLNIKGNEVPLELPFSLAIDGDQAEMRGDLTLDRRAFGIGDNMPDPANLAFEVSVKVTLTAIRGGDAS